MALPINRFATTSNLAAHRILPDVQTLLKPKVPCIAAHRHKLNMYGPGGFFKAHKACHCAQTLLHAHTKAMIGLLESDSGS